MAGERQNAAVRLGQILWNFNLVGSAPYGASSPAISFTESRVEDLEYLLARGYFDPWGVVVYRADVFDAGGAPVWSVRSDVLPQVPEHLRVWAARLEPGESEWLHEREWRIPAQRIGFPPLRLVALIVGDLNWAPYAHEQVVSPYSGKLSYLWRAPPMAAQVPRWYWDASQQRLLTLQPWEDQYQDL